MPMEEEHRRVVPGALRRGRSDPPTPRAHERCMHLTRRVRDISRAPKSSRRPRKARHTSEKLPLNQPVG